MSNRGILQSFDLSRAGVLMFGLAVCAFGIETFLFSEIAMGRAPQWPESWPGKILWCYSSAVFFVVTGVLIASRRYGHKPAMALGIYLFIWAVMRNLLAGNLALGTEITWTGKSIVLTGGALGIAGIAGNSPGLKSVTTLRWTARCALAFFLILCGLEHFMFVQFIKSLVPRWIPGEEFWTYAAGVFLIAGGIGLLPNRTLRAAATCAGLMVFIWLIILHIPRALDASTNATVVNEWIAVAEALAVCGIAFALVPQRVRTTHTEPNTVHSTESPKERT